jgi:hypothetical protein
MRTLSVPVAASTCSIDVPMFRGKRKLPSAVLVCHTCGDLTLRTGWNSREKERDNWKQDERCAVHDFVFS